MPKSVKDLNLYNVYFEHLGLMANISSFILGIRNLEICFDNGQENMEEFLLFRDNLFQNLESLSLVKEYFYDFSTPCIDLFVEKVIKLKNLKNLKLIGLIKKLKTNVESNYLTQATFNTRLPENILNLNNLKSLFLEDFTREISLSEIFLKDLVNMEKTTLKDVFDSIDSDAQYLFQSLTKLEKLSFRENKMETVKSSYFEYLVNLEVLVLSSNNIRIIESGSFKG